MQELPCAVLLAVIKEMFSIQVEVGAAHLPPALSHTVIYKDSIDKGSSIFLSCNPSYVRM